MNFEDNIKASEIFIKSIKHLAVENYDSSYMMDQKIIYNFLKKIGEDKKANDKFLNELADFILILDQVAVYQHSTGIDNSSLVEFSNYALVSEFKYERFSVRPLSNFLSNLIMANVKIGRIKTALTIFKKYRSRFNDPKKAQLYKNLLLSNWGQLSIQEDIMPLFWNFENIIRKFNAAVKDNIIKSEAIREKRLYLSDMLTLSEKLKIEVPGLIDICILELKNAQGSTQDRIHALVATTSKISGILSEATRTWVISLNYDNLNENWQRIIRVINKNIEIVNMHSKLEIELAPKQNDKKLEMYNRLSEMVRDKNVSKEFLSDFTIKTERYYLDCVNAEKDTLICIKYFRILYLVKSLTRYNVFWGEYEKQLNKIPSVKTGDTAFIFINDFSLANGILALPILLEAKKRGFYCIPSSSRTFKFNETQDEVLNSIAGSMNGDIDLRYMPLLKPKLNWRIDINGKRIEANNFNIYQPIFERISRFQLTYFFNYETDACARAKVYQQILYFDRLFQYFEEIEIWATQNNVKVRFLSIAPHVLGGAAARIYCETKGYKNDLNFVCLSSGYDNYFKNMGDTTTETLAALNLTKNEYSRNAFLGTKEGFEKYYKDNVHRINEIKVRVASWLELQRSHLSNEANTTNKDNILKLIKKYKAEGKKVYLVNGKVVFDLGVKYTKGCAHYDMTDWITHTVDVIKKNPDVLLLIKPHPHEQRKDITLSGEKITVLKDLIQTPLSENIIYLDNNSFKLIELIDYLDLGILWNGTSSLEFAAQGIKTIVADVWGHYDYPIGFINFNTKEEYEDILNNPGNYTDKEDIRERAIVFLDYMGSESVSIKNPYGKSSSVNLYQFTKTEIYDDAINNFIENGDLAVEDLVDKIL